LSIWRDPVRLTPEAAARGYHIDRRNPMPRYIALIYGNEAKMPTPGSPERQQMFQSYTDFSEDVQKAGVMRGGDGLQPTSTATTIRAQDGKVLTTDGPFAETKEQLGGFFSLECKDLDEAIHWASKIPVVAAGGCVELRPVIEM
jgi:hypothetical protein